MTLNIKFQVYSSVILIALSSACFAGENYKKYEDEITCGKMKVSVRSTCVKGEDSESLNTCKPQILQVTRGTSKRNINMPELNKKQIDVIKKSNGKVSDLFAINMGCAIIRNAHYAVIYYSIGGGSAQYSEAWAIYDENGNLLDQPLIPLYGKKFDEIYKNMKKINSIMPD